MNIVKMSEFVDLPPFQIVPALADRGIYIASESTFYRILREEGLQHHRGNSKAPERIKIPATHISTAPNQVWTWDITWLNTHVRGMYFKLYMIIDIYSRKIVGWEVWPEETGELASDLVERAVISEKIKGKPLILHSDNPYSEAQFRTLKYRPGYPQDGFKSIDDAREWVLHFVDWFNNKHYHSGINFLTPNSRHTGESAQIMLKRKSVYESARILNPQIFNRGIRKLEEAKAVALNPINEKKDTMDLEVI
ncbi:MAG: DDE-type integrase/transposase/recombinase [Romboutsia sp.]